MAWSYDDDALAAAREEAGRDLEVFGGDQIGYERLGRAQLWLDDVQDARASFRKAADSIRERVIDRGRGDHATTWATYGFLLHRAGDDEAAHAAFERARGLVADPTGERAVGELRYLLEGEPPDGDGLYPETLRALAARDPAAIERARDEVIRAIRAERSMPDVTAGALTLYDLLEETFGAEPPSHREILERAGLLSAPSTRPAIEPPPVGRWTIAATSLEQGEEGPIVARLGDDLCVEFVLSFGAWEVRVYRDGMELNVSGMHPTFGEAVEAAADALRAHAGEWAVDALDALLAQYGQPH